MAFFNRRFGVQGQPADVPPEPEPKFPDALLRVTAAEVVRLALAWRREGRGSFAPAILGPAREFTLKSRRRTR
jgi:hypothetical protein